MLGGVNWIGLFVEDVDALVPFYRDLLGLPLTGRHGNAAQFALPDGAVFELVPGGRAFRQPGRKDHERQGMQAGFAVPDVEAACAALAAKGVTIGAVQTLDDWRWARFVDPEGNVMQLVQQGKSFTNEQTSNAPSSEG